jgi:erythronate-4-phosphate dehydrogenase
MKIVADENIAQLAATFASVGELVALHGRALDAAAVQDADALLVRSITKVDSRLLAGSRCRFVGTATSGIDHVDTDWLAGQGIAFASARGCNADAVVDYVFSAIAGLSERDGFDWRALSFGIVGCGEIGRRLASRLLALGMRVAIYDPFLDATHRLAAHFTDYDTVLDHDVVTFHTPLTRTGPWPTRHMFDAQRIAALRPGQILVNASRGGVIDNAALLAHLEKHPQQRVVLDAWEGEPAISLPLLERVRSGSAHIAGYSLEGKVRGTQMIARAFAAHFGLQVPEPPFGPAGVHPLHVDSALPPWRQLNSLMLQVYDVARDDALLRDTRGAPDAAAQFDGLRKHYPLRREFALYEVPSDVDPALRMQAAALGFRV